VCLAGGGEAREHGARHLHIQEGPGPGQHQQGTSATCCRAEQFMWFYKVRLKMAFIRKIGSSMLLNAEFPLKYMEQG